VANEIKFALKEVIIARRVEARSAFKKRVLFVRRVITNTVALLLLSLVGQQL